MTVKPPAVQPGNPVLTDPTWYTGGTRHLRVYGTPEKPQLYADDPGAWSGTSVNATPADLARFARDILSWLGEDNGLTLPPWEPAVNGSGKRAWFLIRGRGGNSDRVPVSDRYHYGPAGYLIRYASFESAQRAAGKLNRQADREAARARLEYLRSEIRAERISYGEIAELQSLAPYIEAGDTELLEWAGVPEQETR